LKSSNTFEEVKVGLDMVSGSVAAYGDFNGDKFTDVFILDSSLQKLSVYLWQTNSTSFVPLNTANIDVSSESLYIVNVISNDFNYDGKLDVLIMATKEKSDKPNNELIMKLYLGNQKSFDKFVEVPSSMNIQPTLIDFYGNMRPNLLGYPYNQNNIYKLHVWKFNDTKAEIQEVSLNDKEKKKEFCKISLPHSNAFIDLDGDCLSDLFVTCDDGTFEIWKNTVDNDKGFVFSKSGKLPENIGPISFADMDGDGTIDMVFYEWVNTGSTWSKKKEWNLHIVYNKQIPLCSKTVETNCRSVHDLCSADNNYTFDFDLEGDGHIKIPIKEPIEFDSLYDKANIPIPIRIGDINMDGYPDIVLSVSDTTKPIEIYESIPCSEKFGCSKNAVKAKRRTLVYSEHSKVLNRRQNIRSAAFMDIEENGTVDILLFGEQDANKRIYTVINNLHNDAFFMKTITLNGACSSICSLKDEKYSPFGVNHIGSTFKFTVIDLVGQKRANQVAQLSQSNYNALQTPYCLFGLGRTNSYMEELFVGVSRRKSKHYNIYSGMIPNSQLIIIPYQQENEDPSSWQLKQFINPSEYVPYVFISLVCTIVILIIITLLLQFLEKREDELEKKRALHIINFDAF
jgi:integrin alpha FG-GAP repeat containing protein 1